mmetsp:Transcript_19268/g.39813  ORF Transcript_19268/g.39813 Transcript_19268/m.39813 type:complete len:227 (+) Transcript_19268:874-1554(+)
MKAFEHSLVALSGHVPDDYHGHVSDLTGRAQLAVRMHGEGDDVISVGSLLEGLAVLRLVVHDSERGAVVYDGAGGAVAKTVPAVLGSVAMDPGELEVAVRGAEHLILELEVGGLRDHREIRLNSPLGGRGILDAAPGDEGVRGVDFIKEEGVDLGELFEGPVAGQSACLAANILWDLVLLVVLHHPKLMLPLKDTAVVPTGRVEVVPTLGEANPANRARVASEGQV